MDRAGDDGGLHRVVSRHAPQLPAEHLLAACIRRRMSPPVFGGRHGIVLGARWRRRSRGRDD